MAFQAGIPDLEKLDCIRSNCLDTNLGNNLLNVSRYPQGNWAGSLAPVGSVHVASSWVFPLIMEVAPRDADVQQAPWRGRMSPPVVDFPSLLQNHLE